MVSGSIEPLLTSAGVQSARSLSTQGAKSIMCRDHTKFGRRSGTPLCDLEPIDTIVTDSQAPVELVQALLDRGIEVVVATNAPD